MPWEAGEPGTRLFKLIEQRGAVPLAWGENGFREVTNSKRPIRRPEDLEGPARFAAFRGTDFCGDFPSARREAGHHEL